jgi:hypothetical protein
MKSKVNMVTLYTAPKFAGFSKGKVLQCFLLLLEDTEASLTEKGQPVSQTACDLAFLTDICGHLIT